jgi:positive regulator of sigma E activity
MTFAILGGLLLNIGAYLTYKGRIYQAVIVYLFADLCWMIMAYVRDDMLGAFFIIVGTTFGFLAFMKMQRGEMNKSLNKEENDL